MSATGRRRRGAQDHATATMFAGDQPTVEAPAKVTGKEFYPTPRDAILPILQTDLLALPGGIWIEPAAGTGAIIRVVNEVRADVRWRVFEIDPEVGQHLVPLMRPGLDKLAPFGDWIGMPWPPTWTRADVCMFNPPFKLTMPFVAAAFARAHWIVMLQRSNWFGTQQRAPVLRRYCPDQYTLPKRPSFTPDGGTDSAEYSWFVWPPGDRERRRGQLAMLEEAREPAAALSLE